MMITATEFKNKVGQYLEMVTKEAVIITKNGKSVAMLVPPHVQETPITDKLYGCLSYVKEPIDEKKIRKERLDEKYELDD